ncbi:hypothetical protein [Fodinibius halophilus]|uniref:Secreted protein n=1 Tax=Fodinibius halophilus TaxID=1736908 RepID=A0A6M1T7W0_9BACT|nr:hypothetical protein [Fodinibius halophilus]NGP89505.1 hypothetical protein [Fodinibius halophilus]
MRYLYIALILLVSSNAVAQNIYHDTQRLSEYAKQGKFTGTDTTGIYVYTQILRSYLPESIAADTSLGPKEIIDEFMNSQSENHNPILSKRLRDLDVQNNVFSDLLDPEKLPQVRKGAMEALGGFNVTTIADGVAKFLVERANKELSIAFFRRFKKEINKNVELKKLFPATVDLLNQIDPMQYPNMLSALKKTIQKDIANFVTNIGHLVEADKYQKWISKHEDLGFILIGLEVAQIVSELTNGTHPADVIDGLGQYESAKKVSGNLANALQVVSLLSASIRDSSDGRAYATIQELENNIFNDAVARDIFLGLLYQRSLHITFETEKGKKVNFATIIKKISELEKGGEEIKAIYQNLLTHFSEVKNSFKNLKDTPKSERNYHDYYSFFETIPNFIEASLQEVKKIYLKYGEEKNLKNFSKEIEKYVRIARKGGQVYKDINEKDYALAIVNFVEIYDYAIGSKIETVNGVHEELLQDYEHCINNIAECTGPAHNDITELLKEEHAYFGDIRFSDLEDDKCKRKALTKKLETYFEDHIYLDKRMGAKILKYGLFIANVAQAENSDQVQAAIKAVVLPAGSSVIKRRSQFNVSINAYLGGFLGREMLTSKEKFKLHPNSFGMFAPIGISGSFSFSEKNKSSFSLFLSIIDLGAVASIRTQDDVEELPEFTLENIIAPGAYAAYNIRNVPLTVMAGAQLGPQLRKFETDETETTTLTESSVWRWQIAITVDIPLFNLYTKPWN